MNKEINFYLDFLKAENVWDYALGYEKIPNTNEIFKIFPREMFKSIRQFGKICSIPFLDYATTTPDRRELEEDFVTVYNEMLYVIIELLQNLAQNQTSLSLSNIVLIAKISSKNDKIKHNIDQIFTPNYQKPANIQAEILNNEVEVREIVKKFIKSIIDFSSTTNISLDEIKNYVLFNQNHVINNRKSK